MANGNPSYLRTWPNEQLITGGGGGASGTVTSISAGNGLLGGVISSSGTLSVNYGTSAELITGTNTTKLFHAAAMAGASIAGLSAGAADAGKFVRLGANGKLDASMLPAGVGSGTVTSITAVNGLTGGTITATGTIGLSTTGVTAGTYRSVTVDTYGRVLGGTNPTTLAGYGITDALQSTRQITGGMSLAGGGDLTADRIITLFNDQAAPGFSKYYGTDSVGAKGWHALPSAGGSGDVVGPAVASDNGVARYDGTTGKLIQGSGVFIDDLNNVTGVVNLTTSGSTILGNAAADTVTLNGDTMSVPNDLSIEGDLVYIDAANNRVGFQNGSPQSIIDYNGTASCGFSAPNNGVLDLADAQIFGWAPSSNMNWSFSNVPVSRSTVVVLVVKGGGAYAHTWPATVKWAGGTPPMLTVGGTDVLVFFTMNGGVEWQANSFGLDHK